MEGIQVIEFKREILDEKIKTKFEGDVKKVVLHKFWNSHGSEISQGTDTFKNCHVKIVERSYKEFGRRWKHMEVFIDGKDQEVELVSAKGSETLLTLKGCIGAG